MINTNSEGVPKDDPYPISVKKFETLSPRLTTVDEESLTTTELGNKEEAYQGENILRGDAREDVDDHVDDEASKALYKNVLERVGKVVSSAAKNTPHEVDVNSCIVEELSSVDKEGTYTRDSLFYRDGKPTTLIFDDEEVVLEAVCIQAQAALTELKENQKLKRLIP